jgi:hypothetical protein
MHFPYKASDVKIIVTSFDDHKSKEGLTELLWFIADRYLNQSVWCSTLTTPLHVSKCQNLQIWVAHGALWWYKHGFTREAHQQTLENEI